MDCEDLLQVARLGQLLPVVESHELGGRGRDERAEGGRRHVRHLAQEVDILRVIDELVVADQRSIWLAAGRSKLILVQLLEDLALVELDGLVDVVEQLALGDVQHLDLQHGAGLAVHHQVVEPAPGPFQFLKVGMVHDRGKLRREFLVDRLDGGVDRLGDVLVERDDPGQRLVDQRLHQLFGT